MMKTTSLRSIGAAFALAIVAGLGVGQPAAAQDAGPTQLGGVGAAPAAPALAPFARTRAILQAQNAPTLNRGGGIAGAESSKMYETYLNSIGKGGAGPAIEGVSAATSGK